MGRIKKYIVLSLLSGIYLWVPAVALAQTIWINSTDYSPKIYPKFGTRTKVYFGYGQRYPVDDFLPQDQLEEFYWVCPRCGKHHALEPNPGGFLATELKFKKPGSYVVCAAINPGFYTMYIEKGKVHHEIGPKTGLENVILSLYSEQYAKALINAGEELGDAFKKPVGQKVEIIPLENPFNLKEGGFLPVQVLFEGKMAKFWPVYATYNGFSTDDDFAYATSTNSEGIAKIRILRHGPWLIKTTNKFPAPEELEEKCNQLHYTATLTFEIP